MNDITRVFVSGCFDVLHGGHIQFFHDAKSLGDRLIVCFASDESLRMHKHREPAMPEEHKYAILRSLKMVDDVFCGRGEKLGLDFEPAFIKTKPDILAVTADDKYADLKRELCNDFGAQYVVLPKCLSFEKTSTTDILRRGPAKVPLRVDFAGGWLDVPRLSRQGGHIVNCAITPTVSNSEWPYKLRSGLGGSAAHAILNGQDAFASEDANGVGWQDPAVILETGLCVWSSWSGPLLELKVDPYMLHGKMALWWTGKEHDTPGLADNNRDYDGIMTAGEIARAAVVSMDIRLLHAAVDKSYEVQLKEGMESLPDFPECAAKKYCGGGWGGYALYMFYTQHDRDAFVRQNENAMKIEPYIQCRKPQEETVIKRPFPEGTMPSIVGDEAGGYLSLVSYLHRIDKPITFSVEDMKYAKAFKGKIAMKYDRIMFQLKLWLEEEGKQ